MYKDLIKIMGISVAVVLPVVIFILRQIEHRDKVKNNIGASLLVKKNRSHYTYKIYDFLLRFPLSRAYVDRISRRYEMLCPADSKETARKTVRLTLVSWGLCAAAVFILFIMKPNYNNALVSLLLIYVINSEVIGYMVNRSEIQLLEQMTVFVSDVRHNYYIKHMVDDAILLSIEDLKPDMKVHARKIYDIVTSNNLREDIINYNATMHNKYMKMFLSLCASILEYSDKKVNGQLLFAANLENLKKEIELEVLKLRNIRFLFAGKTFVTISVCVPIEMIKKFGLSILPEMNSFYNGRPGIIFIMVTMLTAFTIYLLNNRLKETTRQIPRNSLFLKKLERVQIIKMALDNYEEKNYGKILILRDTLKRIGESVSPRQLLIKRMLMSVIAFVISIVFLLFIHMNNKYEITHIAGDISNLTSAANAKQLDNMKTVIIDQVNLFKDEKSVTKTQVLNSVVNTGAFYNTKINEALAKEINRRIGVYHAEYFKWYELLASMIIMVIAYHIPYLLILYRKKVLQLNMEDEVTQFNAIIYMLMYIDHITVKDLLEQMELFAVVFKQSLQECINDYNSGDIAALERMKERERYAPFRRLVDNLIRCDNISIEKAFDEIATDRENYHYRRKQENDISVQKRNEIATPLSFIPTVLVMIYLTLPLVIAGMNNLSGFNEMIKSV